MKTKKKERVTILGLLNTVLLLFFVFLCVYPLYYIFINSISTAIEVQKGIFLFPRQITMMSYTNINNIQGIYSSIFISVSRTVVGSLVTCLFTSILAFLLTQREMPARKAIYRFVIVTMYINAGFIPYYLLISNLGLKNSFLVYILPGSISAYYLVLIKTYIESLPMELMESADIDGAGPVRKFVSLIIPLAKPILACIITFAAVWQWNSWSDNLFFIQGSKGRNLHTLQFLLYQNLQSNMSSAIRGTDSAAAAAAIKITPTTLRMAMTFITVLPILCVYPFMQRYFTSGIMLGAVKG